ncbi:hypothetical protein CL630_00125 [bacterium]|nr:hypothetical protein [bacterium]
MSDVQKLDFGETRQYLFFNDNANVSPSPRRKTPRGTFKKSPIFLTGYESSLVLQKDVRGNVPYNWWTNMQLFKKTRPALSATEPYPAKNWIGFLFLLYLYFI